MRILLMIAALLIAGCQSTIPTTPETSRVALFQDEQFLPVQETPLLSDLHALRTEQAEAFLTYFHNPAFSHLREDRRVYRYLDRLTDSFDYDEATLSAAEAVDLGRGNCMTLAILTTSLARLAGLEVSYQLAESDPIYTLTDNHVLKGVHVRTLLLDPNFEPEAGQWVLRRPGTVVDYFPSGHERFVGNVSDADYAARIYLNHAADAMAEEDFDTAYWYVKAALTEHPGSAQALNYLAVLYRQKGDLASAEATYRHALSIAEDQPSLLRNYELLLRSQQRSEEAQVLAQKIVKLDDASPHRWYLAGREALAQGQYQSAIIHLRRAGELAPYSHNIHFALARAYAGLGRTGKARNHLQLASETTNRPSTRSLYSKKLELLKR